MEIDKPQKHRKSTTHERNIENQQITKKRQSTNHKKNAGNQQITKNIGNQNKNAKISEIIE